MAILLTILGIALVLFVHELGHYMTARMAGMRVETFALGFGPRVWGFRRGGTDFRLALFPLGGYVLVAGESGLEQPQPGDLMACPPRWRLLFFAGGILMNLAFAFVLLPLLFAVGVPFESPVIGAVEPGSAAWQAGLQRGDRVLEVEGRSIHGFRHVATAVALAPAAEPVSVRVERDGEELEFVVPSSFDAGSGFRRIGVGPWLEPAPLPGGAAERAGLRATDEVLAIGGLPVSGTVQTQLAVEQAAFAGGAVPVRVRRDGAEMELTIPAAAPLAAVPPQLGVFEQQNRVVAVRAPLADHLHAEDRILRADGAPVQRPADLLRAALRAGHLPALLVLREGAEVALPARSDLAPEALEHALHLGTGPGLRLAMRRDGAAAAAGLQDGDAILRIGDAAVRDFGELRAAITALLTALPAGAPPPSVLLTVLRAGAAEPERVSVTLAPLQAADLGLGLRARAETVRSVNPLTAVGLGMREAWETVLEVALTLRRMVSGDVAVTNLGGILTIGQATHGFASQGLIPLLLFLCIISVNLAVLNLLPLPALDGGQMLLVLIEKLRGRPISLRARNAFHLVGFAFVIGLLIFVTALDLRRLFGG